MSSANAKDKAAPAAFLTDVAEIELQVLRKELDDLRWMVAIKEQRLIELEADLPKPPPEDGLSSEEITRYSRQLILADFGVKGQLRLKKTSFLVVGMGGLGCPAAQYLAAAGCGHIGLVDYDDVEISNCHRQILHLESKIGLTKVESARQALMEINPRCVVKTHHMLLTNANAMMLFKNYDVILDCSDNVPTRYLLNDTCVLLNKPLISGSALKMDGQVTVYNYGAEGPCFRCVFPVPPPPQTVTNCSEAGVLGAVTGVIGSLQALEAIKMVTGELGEVLAGRLLIFDAARCNFRTIRLRSRRKECEICATENPLLTSLVDYEQFCGMHASDRNPHLALLPPSQRINAKDYDTLKHNKHLLIDVRTPIEFEICRMPDSVNVPLHTILDNSFESKIKNHPPYLPIVVVCRRGNDSQVAVQHMLTRMAGRTGPIKDMIGGLHAWHHAVDKKFPIY